ncbi:hypothetical protein D9758_015605 [Tetrapyrgos nigripes]|uniref:Uncharacterized protein n=1 Tax=Tetrapyrgos nigripes TaxID=182062 RepID=A0A8H5FK10_9AGAR|nr:hypothetical protein D9758_015605 [Tetrapyrgos nigripes]
MSNDIFFPSSPSSSPSPQKEPSKTHAKHRSRDISFSELDPALREQLKPNAHPYAIKTTSTGILSRSNSTTSNYQRETRHSYVPTSPVAGSPIRHPRQRPAGQGHRKSSASFSGSESPRPLPTPPPSAVDGIPSTPPPRVRPFPHRTDPFAGVDSHNSFGGDDLSWIRRPVPIAPTSATNSAADLADLPPNPKLWTPSQLSAYLTTALRVRSGVKKKASVDSFNVEASGDGEDLKLPVRVAQDIAAFVRDKKINGRVFLRWEEGDLEK